MIRAAHPSRSTFLFLVLAGALLALAPPLAVAHPGGCHNWAGEAATILFGAPTINPYHISRERPVALLPEFEVGWSWYNTKNGCCSEDDAMFLANWDWMRSAAQDMDDYDSDTRHHFWTPEWGLHHVVNDTAGINNAWESVHEHWVRAIDAWNEGNLGEAYSELGYALHFVQDGGQPAHANDDMHPGGALDDDAFEDWLTGDYCKNNFHWDLEHLDANPGPIPYPPNDNATLLNQILAANGGCWDESCDYPIEPDTNLWEEQDRYLFNLEAPYTTYNMQQFFYVMYWTNQIGNYIASDAEPGDGWEPIGWVDYHARFGSGEHFHCGPDCTTSLHDPAGLADNDEGDNNDDGDLGTVAYYGYGASMAGTVAVVELFRRTVDAVPPVSTVTKQRADGLPYKEWNNSNVRVEITGATDFGNPNLRDSHVYKLWGKVDGIPPSPPDQIPVWTISGDGVHKVEVLTIDWMGNIESPASDFDVKVDQTPPEVSFPALRPNYLTSESFTAIWTATDETSGVASEVAYLDNQSIAKGQVFNLAQMAGRHSLRVIVYDKADNYTDVSFEFEVWIAANGWCLPVHVNDKTKGEGLTCVVEFPAYYSVAAVSLPATTFAVKGQVDLSVADPVVAETATLPGLLLTGVGDHDSDGVPDRKAKFDKALFVQALGGSTGSIGSVIQGGLLPNGEPRFLAPVVVPVF